MERFIDMHIHSIKSDGENSNKEIFKMAYNKNIATLSITDHDVLPDHKNEVLAKKYGINYINGVEISSIMNDQIKMHILAYNYDYNKEKELDDILAEIQLLRKEKILFILEKLEENRQINFNKNQIEQILNRCGSVSTLHLMQLLMKEGYGDNFDDIYKSYIKSYRSKINIRKDSEEVLDKIHKSNGISILAHPKKIETTYHIQLEDIIEELIYQGLDGIEVAHSIHAREDIERYKLIALKYHLLMSVGSDYHGPHIRANRILGEVSKEGDKVKKLTLLEKINQKNIA